MWNKERLEENYKCNAKAEIYIKSRKDRLNPVLSTNVKGKLELLFHTEEVKTMRKLVNKNRAES